MKEKNKLNYIFTELSHHLPHSIFGILLGITGMGILTFLAILVGREERLPYASRELFHVAHVGHVLLSAVTTTAMFVKHEKRFGKAILVGVIGSLSLCGMSDILIPFVGGWLLGHEMALHICILEEPRLVIPFMVVGVIIGLLIPRSFEHSTEYTHSAHVLFSSSASLLYMLAFGLIHWTHMLGSVFLVTIIAVMLPCCASDIVFPLACVHRDCSHS